MSHPDPHAIQAAHAAAPAPAGQPYFPADEWAELRAEDVHAGKAVVGLMISIFTIGLLLYTGVFLAVKF